MWDKACEALDDVDDDDDDDDGGDGICYLNTMLTLMLNFMNLHAVSDKGSLFSKIYSVQVQCMYSIQ